MKGKLVSKCRIATLAWNLWKSTNRFVRVEWESDHSKRLRKGAVDGSGQVNPYWGQKITKRYIALVRNHFSFTNSVRAECARRGEPHPDYECGERAWGEHIPHTPFVWHFKADEGIRRLHLHLLPVKYMNAAHTGYYVDGVQVDYDTVEPFIPIRKEPIGVVDTARFAKHPVNARMDDVKEIKIGQHFYALIEPTISEIEQLVKEAREYSEQQTALKAAG